VDAHGYCQCYVFLGVGSALSGKRNGWTTRQDIGSVSDSAEQAISSIDYDYLIFISMCLYINSAFH